MFGSARLVLFSSIIDACRRGEKIQHNELRVEQKSVYKKSWLESVVREVENNLLNCFTVKTLGCISENLQSAP